MTFATELDKAQLVHPDGRDIAVGNCFNVFLSQQGPSVDHCVLREAQTWLALIAQKDMSWKKALASEERDKVIEAFHKERDSLLDTVLVPISKDDSNYAKYYDLAITGRYLLDIKRSGRYKARGVKQGFKEDKITADGPGFNYYSHVTKLDTFRMVFFRVNRGTRRCALLDVATAFLQSDNFPEDLQKFLLMWHPINREWELHRQLGPLYGENSAPRRWEDTFAPSLEAEDYVRADNDRAIFYHPERDMVNLCYVDDNFIDGEEDDIHWAHERIKERFDCNELEMIPVDGTPIDYLGMAVSMDGHRTYVSMEKYIDYALESLGWTSLKVAQTPIRRQINPEGDSPKLPSHLQSKFHTANGMLGWLQLTGRPDVSYAYSRIGQHQANVWLC